MEFEIKTISEGSAPPKNDDLVSFYKHSDDILDIWIIDGASSVADKDYIDFQRGDPTWFVHSFDHQLREKIKPEKTIETAVGEAIADISEVFLECVKCKEMPLYARPLAALTFIRIIHQADKNFLLELYSLGDCTALVSIGGIDINLDPYTNHQEKSLSKRIEELKKRGLTYPEEIKKELLPFLRERRQQQNEELTPNVLCLTPKGRFDARQRLFELTGEASLLLMTDGFYRLVDTYNIYTDSSLLKESQDKDLDVFLKELRCFEKQNNASFLSVKIADDASALKCKLR